MLYTLRVAVETTALSAKGLATLVLVQQPGFPPAIAFSWGQLAYATVTLAGYGGYFVVRLCTRRSACDHRGGTASTAASDVDGGTDPAILRLCGTFTLQASLHTKISQNTMQKEITTCCLAAGCGEAHLGRRKQDGGGRISRCTSARGVWTGAGPRLHCRAHHISAL